MYDPARDIFTENQPSSSSPIESYDLSALDTLADLAAEAEVASVPVKQENAIEPVKGNDVKEAAKESVKENGRVEPVQSEISAGNVGDDVIPGGGVEVARTKEPELSLKVTLHLKRDKNKSQQEDMQVSNETDGNDAENSSVLKEEQMLHDMKVDNSVH